MEIRNILVNVDTHADAPDLLPCAVGIARRFEAKLIGMAAAQPSPALVDVNGITSDRWYAEEQKLIDDALGAAERHFRTSIPTGLECVWRGYVDNPNHALASLACRADLVMVGSNPGAPLNYLRRLNIGEFLLAAGRPLLVAADDVTEIKAERIVVAWKDSREARRSVADALPFLKAADEVLAVTVDEGDYTTERTGLEDLVAWLQSHDVKVRSDVLINEGAVVASIQKAASSFEADLIVSGGYGHTRLREWLFGGVTHDLLESTKISRFLSN